MQPSQQAAAPCPRAGRRGRVLEAVAGAGLDALLVTGPANVRYLTGFTGSNGWLLLGAGRAVFLTDPRYQRQAAEELAGVEVTVSAAGLPAAAAEVLPVTGWGRVGFEPDHLTVAIHAKLAAIPDLSWKPHGGVVESLRRRKDGGEREAIVAALRIAEAALVEVTARIEPGYGENRIAAELEMACRLRGARGMAFDTIVAAGPRSALPHGVAGERPVRAGEPVMIDIGCRVGGYCSDITRMVWLGGEPDPEWLALHQAVDGARGAAMARIAAGVAAADIDATARGVLQDADFGAGIKHGTGHGVGLEIHEAPALSSRSSEVLEAGMVLTVEPGLYLEERYGVRIEDMVAVTADGCERLTALGTEPILREP
ncbi:MAG TPA: Xaa-Pro peptidase family protein [Acidobacteriota bacterium]